MPTYLPCRSLGRHVVWQACVWLVIGILGPSGWGMEIRFNRDIRPILAEHCFACHGPDASHREAKLRLDQSESAYGVSETGHRAIVPGSPEASELLVRVRSHDAEIMMPPPNTRKPLTTTQIERLEAWIQQGAPYELHWAYLPIQRPSLPAIRDTAWPRNAIDYFILSQLEHQALAPSLDAPDSKLLRRVTLDLTGLPPTPSEIEAFSQDCSPDRYARAVDRLLASEGFGERMAVEWLDAARYADTNGYQVDRDREMFLWRDWVIQAFNSNMPFDQFTIEQLAGDLLPNPTISQRIATGLHRNHMMNEETGIIPEEFIAEYTADRVETTATVWLGQTFNCARCHDHKFDPFTQRDFYSLKAFFHNVPEKGIGDFGSPIRVSNPPYLRLPTLSQRAELQRLDRDLRDLQCRMDELKSQAWGEILAHGIGIIPAESKVPQAWRDLQQRDRHLWTDADYAAALEFRTTQNPDHNSLVQRIESLQKNWTQLDQAIVTALVMAELPTPRATRILRRGIYDAPGELVEPQTPAVLPALAESQPRNRLGLARWLVDERNPLTARVTVNRYWQMLFGQGLVRTSEDFGSQGTPPTNSQLLDWLAAEFMQKGWNVKAILRTIVLSRTYQQSSHRTPSLQDRDPENQWHARGARFRLPAEVIRDHALYVSGLLVPRLGGPSVKPYHPPGLYEQVVAAYGTNSYSPDQGEKLYRRSLYTYWKRSVPNPSMLVLDAPFRESCVVRRARTNTPIQALNLLNDPTYVEAAAHLARRMLLEGGTDVSSQIRWGHLSTTGRTPDNAELATLLDLYHSMLKEFQVNPADISPMLPLERFAALKPQLDLPHWAAMSVTASVLLNLDETITHD